MKKSRDVEDEASAESEPVSDSEKLAYVVEVVEYNIKNGLLHRPPVSVEISDSPVSK